MGSKVIFILSLFTLTFGGSARIFAASKEGWPRISTISQIGGPLFLWSEELSVSPRNPVQELIHPAKTVHPGINWSFNLSNAATLNYLLYKHQEDWNQSLEARERRTANFREILARNGRPVNDAIEEWVRRNTSDPMEIHKSLLEVFVEPKLNILILYSPAILDGYFPWQLRDAHRNSGTTTAAFKMSDWLTDKIIDLPEIFHRIRQDDYIRFSLWGASHFTWRVSATEENLSDRTMGLVVDDIIHGAAEQRDGSPLGWNSAFPGEFSHSHFSDPREFVVANLRRAGNLQGGMVKIPTKEFMTKILIPKGSRGRFEAAVRAASAFQRFYHTREKLEGRLTAEAALQHYPDPDTDFIMSLVEENEGNEADYKKIKAQKENENIATSSGAPPPELLALRDHLKVLAQEQKTKLEIEESTRAAQTVKPKCIGALGRLKRIFSRIWRR